MIANLLFTHRRYFALAIIAIIVVGLNSFRTIPRQEDPTITNFSASIVAPFPGATPDRVEALVTRPLEDELLAIPEVDEVHSVSRNGMSFVNVLLHDTLSDEAIERAWSEIRDAILDAHAQFPAGLPTPVFDNDRLASYTAIIAFSGKPDIDLPLSLLHRLAQDFTDQVRILPGTRQVDMFGEPEEEVRVELDRSALLSRGLSVDRVAEALSRADARMASGRATGDAVDLPIEIAGEFDSLERVREVIVRAEAEGSATRVGDIARVYKARVTPPPSMALAQGKEAILIGVVMEDGQRVDRWDHAFQQFLQDYRQQAPAGLLIEQTYNQSSYTNERLGEVAFNLAVGVVLVIAVLLFTLGWRAAIVVAVVLPLCGLTSIAILERMGMALHQMSISGLIVALGMLVDGSIVMTDEIRKRFAQGLGALDAIQGSVTRLRVPLLSSSVTTVLTFMPMAILPGPSGDFMGSIATSVVVMLASSTVLSLTLTPVLAALLLPRHNHLVAPWYRHGLHSGKAGETLHRTIAWSVDHKAAAVALSLALPLSGFLSFGTLTAQFFPGTDRDQMYIQVKLPDGRSINDTRALVARMDPLLRAESLIRRVDWTVGESAPPFYYNLYRRKDGVPTWAEALILTTDENQTDALIRRLQVELDEAFPEARISVRGIDQGPPVEAPLEVEIYGPNLALLREIGEQFRNRLAAIPTVTHTGMNLIGGAPKLVFQLDEDRLHLAGLQLADAAAALEGGLRGRTGGEVLEGTERLPVRVRYREGDWADGADLSDLRIPLRSTSTTESIPSVPLSAVGELTLSVSESPITRREGKRVNTVEAYLIRGVLPEEALKALRADLEANPITLPPGYHISFGGDSDIRAKVIDHIMAPMGIILSALFATIVLTFNSWRLSAIAVLVCVCSLGLSLLSLALFRYPFGVQAMIGVIGSVGVSINAAIIIMTALQGNELASKGDSAAVTDVVMDSSRHIISTTLTTVGGFLPLILEGSQFWPPFAMAIAGGVLFSTVISFFLVPPLFALVAQSQAKSNTSRTQTSEVLVQREESA